MTQILVNSIVYASMIAVIAIGISLSYSILRFANFAHIQLAVVGAYLSHVLVQLLGLPLWLAILVAVVLTGCLAMAVDHLVFRHLRAASAESKMIASWGVALFIRSMVAAIFGGSALIFDLRVEPFIWADARFTSLDVIVVAVTIVSMGVLYALLRFNRLGTALRALASNFELAESRGIPSERMIKLMWFLSGAYAALGGTLFALETHLVPNMDLILLLPVFAAVAIGGFGNVLGTVAGAAVLSLLQNALISIDLGGVLGQASWYLPSQFRDFIAVALLVLLLLFRSRGFSFSGAR